MHCGDDPTQRPTNPELRSFVVATLKFVDLVRDIIAKASVFEEEDFQPLHYGFQVNNFQYCIFFLNFDLRVILSFRLKPFSTLRFRLKIKSFTILNDICFTDFSISSF